ncbi:MAG: ABC transporter permease [Actinomycetes bacterium]
MTAVPLVFRQVRLEQRAFWRNPEAAFFTFALPLGLLLLFGAVSQDKIPGRPELRPLTFFVPGIVAFGIVLAAYANLGGTIAILRSSGVLKRLRATPLSPAVYLAGHLVSVLATTLLTAACTVALGQLVFGVGPQPAGLLGLVATLSVGITCFAALGLAISAVIPNGMAAGAVTNGTYIPLALISGTFNSGLQLPGWLNSVVGLLPIKPLTDALHAAYDPVAPAWPLRNLLVLTVWTAIGGVLAWRFFKWEPH